MLEDAQEIFDYLPIRRATSEDEYINHLWDVFSALDTSDGQARPFSIMPFHLLFMLTVQYKILRIAQENEMSSELFFSSVGGRHKPQLLSPQKSVFDIGFINERTIPEMFCLIGVDRQGIKKIKDLVDDRNERLAHAKGGM